MSNDKKGFLESNSRHARNIKALYDFLAKPIAEAEQGEAGRSLAQQPVPMPYNAFSKTPYSNRNLISILSTAEDRQWTSGAMISANQKNKHGLMLQKGSKQAIVIRPQPRQKEVIPLPEDQQYRDENNNLVTEEIREVGKTRFEHGLYINISDLQQNDAFGQLDQSIGGQLLASLSDLDALPRYAQEPLALAPALAGALGCDYAFTENPDQAGYDPISDSLVFANSGDTDRDFCDNMRFLSYAMSSPERDSELQVLKIGGELTLHPQSAADFQNLYYSRTESGFDGTRMLQEPYIAQMIQTETYVRAMALLAGKDYVPAKDSDLTLEFLENQLYPELDAGNRHVIGNLLSHSVGRAGLMTSLTHDFARGAELDRFKKLKWLPEKTEWSIEAQQYHDQESIALQSEVQAASEAMNVDLDDLKAAQPGLTGEYGDLDAISAKPAQEQNRQRLNELNPFA